MSAPDPGIQVIDPTSRWKALAVLAVIAVVAVAVILQQTLSAQTPGPRSAPEIVLTDRHGLEKRLSDYRGKVVLLNFWATWCGPCVMEIPSIENLATTLRREKPDVVLLAASLDDGGWATVDPFLRARGFEALEDSVLIDNHDGAFKFGTNKLPETWVIGRDGTILDPRPVLRGVADVGQSRFIGPQDWNDPRILQYLKSL